MDSANMHVSPQGAKRRGRRFGYTQRTLSISSPPSFFYEFFPGKLRLLHGRAR